MTAPYLRAAWGIGIGLQAVVLVLWEWKAWWRG